MKLSIIIPMYNIENYIEECLQPLVSQESEYEYEVLIINDGSKDKSRDLAEKYIQGLNNFKIIDKKNGGLSSARNTGLNHAIGKYIFFLDGDDFISIYEIFNMVTLAEEYDLEVVIGNGMYYFEDTSKTIIFHQGKALEKFRSIVTGKDFMKYMIEKNCYKMEVWDKLYNRKFLVCNNLKFEEGLLHEDELFTPLVLEKALRIKYYGNIDYFYRQRKGSINNTIKLKNCLDYIKIANELYVNHGENCEFKQTLNIRIIQQYLRAIQLALNLNKEEYSIFKDELEKSYFNECYASRKYSFTIRMRVNIFNNFKLMYFILYKIYKKIRLLTIGKI